MISSIPIKSTQRNQMIDITDQLSAQLQEVQEGTLTVFVTHTTAAVTINENADPDVPRDILGQLEKLAPPDGRYRHAEGNSDAHIKSTLVGASESIPIKNGKMMLGTWQSVFFCEFDGPRERKAWIRLA